MRPLPRPRGRGATGARRPPQPPSSPPARRRTPQLWIALVEGSGNLAYRLALNTLVEGVATYPELDALLNAPRDDADDYAALAPALRSGDGEGTVRKRPQNLLDPAGAD